MSKTILQIPMNKDLKDNAQRAAENQGFSSLQELVRLFLTKLADNRVVVTIQESVPLSSGNEKRYLKMSKDFKKGKNILEASGIDEFLDQLNAN